MMPGCKVSCELALQRCVVPGGWRSKCQKHRLLLSGRIKLRFVYSYLDRMIAPHTRRLTRLSRTIGGIWREALTSGSTGRLSGRTLIPRSGSLLLMVMRLPEHHCVLTRWIMDGLIH